MLYVKKAGLIHHESIGPALQLINFMEIYIPISSLLFGQLFDRLIEAIIGKL